MSSRSFAGVLLIAAIATLAAHTVAREGGTGVELRVVPDLPAGAVLSTREANDLAAIAVINAVPATAPEHVEYCLVMESVWLDAPEPDKEASEVAGDAGDEPARAEEAENGEEALEREHLGTCAMCSADRRQLRALEQTDPAIHRIVVRTKTARRGYGADTVAATRFDFSGRPGRHEVRGYLWRRPAGAEQASDQCDEGWELVTRRQATFRVGE